MSRHDLTDAIHALAGIDGTIPRTAFAIQDVFDARLPDSVLIRRDGDRIQVGYLAHDDSPGDYWENDEGAGTWRAFTRGDDPNEIMAAIEAEGKIAFFVERYSHGLDHYSVANTRAYPDRRFDVGVRGIITPCDDVQEQYRAILAEKGPEAARAHTIADTNRVLDEYSDWCNGAVYGVVVEDWRIEGQHVRKMDDEADWGLIGAETAVSHLIEKMPERELEDGLSM